jgi:hypothetical protein
MEHNDLILLQVGQSLTLLRGTSSISSDQPSVDHVGEHSEFGDAGDPKRPGRGGFAWSALGAITAEERGDRRLERANNKGGSSESCEVEHESVRRRKESDGGWRLYLASQRNDSAEGHLCPRIPTVAIVCPSVVCFS